MIKHKTWKIDDYFDDVDDFEKFTSININSVDVETINQLKV